MGLTFDGTDEQFLRDMDNYARLAIKAVRAVADFFAPQLEGYAKANAIWTDRTGNARQSLHGYVEDFAENVVALYLSYGAGIEYSIYLETMQSGRFAIILPTFEAHYADIMRMLQDIFQ